MQQQDDRDGQQYDADWVLDDYESEDDDSVLGIVADEQRKIDSCEHQFEVDTLLTGEYLDHAQQRHSRTVKKCAKCSLSVVDDKVFEEDVNFFR